MKLLGVLLGGLICSASLGVNTYAQSTRADVELALSFIQVGETMPSRAAQRAFAIETQRDVLAYSQIVRNGAIDFSDAAQRDVLVKAILPALDLIHSMNTRTIGEARLRSVDMVQLRERRQQAFELVAPIGDEWVEADLIGFDSFSMNLNANTFFNEAAACLIPVVNVASVAGGSLDPSNPMNFIADVMVMDGYNGGIFVSVPGGDCRPDANDKKCDENDDPLGNDSCVTATNKYCRLIARNGVSKCSQSSDE